MKKTKIVDTNVAIVSNNKKDETPQATKACRKACLNFISEIVDDFRKGLPDVMALDSGDEIIREYRKYLSPKGQPGVGDAFLYEISQRKFSKSIRLEQLEKNKSGGGYSNFPAKTEFNGFDESDKKFLSLAIACGNKAVIVNAVDSDWKKYSSAIKAEGIEVYELCPDCI